MKKLTTLVLAAMVAMPMGAAAQVSVPALIPIQGFLTDAGGTPLDGDYLITVTLYDDAFGTTVVAIDTQTVAVSAGYFTFGLGATTALDLNAFATGNQLHVGITIESDPEMTPLLPLGSVPYAAAAQNAANADTLDGHDVDDFMLKADGEADPLFSASPVGAVTADDLASWDQAYAWGDHASAGYLTSEADPAFNASAASNISSDQVSQWDQAYAWGDHASAGYLSSEADPAFNASAASNISSSQINQWNQAYTWGNHASANYLTGETDPSFNGSPAGGITQTDISNWNAAAAEGPQPWTIAGNDLYYEAGNVGVGTATPQGALDVYTVEPTGVDTQFIGRAKRSICGSTFCYQSFTITKTGLLTQLRVLVCNSSGDAGSMSLFEGDCATSQSCNGTTNFVQTSQLGTGACDLNNGWGDYLFDPPVPVLAGRSYTFRVNDVTAYENNDGGYAGGAAYEDLNGHLIGDVPFQAIVQPTHRFVVSDFAYFGNPSSDGTFRMGEMYGSLVLQRKVGNAWLTLQSW